MKNTPFKLFLRFWIALTGIIAFLGSWIVLGHTGKPVAADSITAGPSGTSTQGGSQIAPLPTLAPLPSFDSGSAQQFSQPNVQLSQPNFNFTPRFRTRGS